MSQDGYARYQVLDFALTQVPNGLDVIYFLARPENSSLAIILQDAPPHKIAQIAHMISAELRFGSRTKKSSNEEQPRPRAPKPPAEVGGRGAQPDDAALAAARNGSLQHFQRKWIDAHVIHDKEPNQCLSLFTKKQCGSKCT